MSANVYKVIIPYTRNDFFDYDMQGFVAQPGSRVLVSFKNTARVGIIVAIAPPENVKRALKTLQSIIDQLPVLSPEILAL